MGSPGVLYFKLHVDRNDDAGKFNIQFSDGCYGSIKSFLRDRGTALVKSSTKGCIYIQNEVEDVGRPRDEATQ
jgi:hypothetical protein